MKLQQALIYLLVFCCLIAVAQDRPPTKPRIIPVKAELIEQHAQVQVRTAQARDELQASAVFARFQTAVAKENESLIYLMAESGVKPSECKAVFDKDTGKVKHIECAPKP